MDIRFESIDIICHNGTFNYQFAPHITTIYGNIGAGKTSLINLISFCLGSDLVKTQAIDDQLKMVKLHAVYNGDHVMFSRMTSSSFIVIQSEKEEIQVRAKAVSNRDQTITDYFYASTGVEPKFYFYKSRNNAVESEKISFANYYWFSYLKQEEFDSTLFYLENENSIFRTRASRAVLDDLFGGESEIIFAYQQQAKKIAATLKKVEASTKMCEEIVGLVPVLSKNISYEIERKRKLIAEGKEKIEQILRENGENDISGLLKLQYSIGLYEAENRYLREFGKIKEFFNSLEYQKREVSEELIQIKEKIQSLPMDNRLLSSNIRIIEDLFMDLLIQVHFPEITEGDTLKISVSNFLPTVFSYSGRKKFDFLTLSSGGKKTVFKLCYSLAIHRYILQQHIKSMVPNVLIVDTPMKNISEREDKTLYDNLFMLLKNLFSKGGELAEVQLILIDKELHPIFQNDNETQIFHFTAENPLIPYYRS